VSEVGIRLLLAAFVIIGIAEIGLAIGDKRSRRGFTIKEPTSRPRPAPPHGQRRSDA